MSQVKSKRIAPSVVNTPVTFHIKASKALSKEETERLLTKFISNEETRSNQNLIDSSNITTTNTGASVSQLKRIQRDLRGLPPLETHTTTPPPPQSSTASASVPGTITTTVTPKKHMKFDNDDDVSVPEAKSEQDQSVLPQVDEDVEVKDADESPEISKEERKRLKKEKRKAEKRAKLEK